MKPLVLAIIAICFSSCQKSLEHNSDDSPNSVKEYDITIKTIEVLKSDLVLNQLEGVWYFNNQPYNGFALKYHDNDTLIERLGFYNGKRQGIAKTWSPNGVLRIESYYNQNRLTGVYKSFWENGTLALQVNYKAGKKQGEEKQWYVNGTLSKLRQFEDGIEKGIQKAWLPNGKLYVNYEAKNGRIFGLMRANSCYKLENETLIK